MGGGGVAVVEVPVVEVAGVELDGAAVVELDGERVLGGVDVADGAAPAVGDAEAAVVVGGDDAVAGGELASGGVELLVTEAPVGVHEGAGGR